MHDTEEDWEHSGERMVPEFAAGTVLEAEHLARYRFAAPHVAGKTVLDIGCGVGWGSRLLLDEGGAATVTGVDLFAPAIEYAEQHFGGPTYLVGDMTALPVSDASADVVVCFEALEHVHDHLAVLAEVRRVLRPDGLFFVSSPNPDVYPEGNPYHLHEVRPDELRRSIADEFGSVRLFSQELLVASVVSERGSTAAAVHTTRTGALDGLTEQYGIAVAGDGELPALSPNLVLTVSSQLTHLERAHADLQQDRDHFQAQAEEVAEEHRRLRDTAESAGANAQLLQQQVRNLQEELVDAGRALRGVMDERDTAAARAEEAERQIAEDSSRTQLESTRIERDEVLLALLQSEQERARLVLEIAELAAGPDTDAVEQLTAVAAALAQQVTELQRSSSWRITAPLRRARDAQLRLRESGRRR
jgi:SAM-dependent methyltransferase